MTVGSAAVDDTRPRVATRALAPLAVALCSLALGVVALGHRSLSAAEASLLDRADVAPGDLLSRIVHHDPGQAASLVLARVGSTLGHGEAFLRLPSAVLVAVATGLAVVLGTMLLGRMGGLLTGIAFAGNAGVVEASRESGGYAPGLLGVVGATVLLVWGVQRGGTWRWCAYAVCAALLPLTHPLAASVLLAHAAALASVRDRSELRRAGVALLVALVAAGALLAWMTADRRDAVAGAPDLSPERVGRGLWHAAGSNPLLVVAAIAGLVALLGAARVASGLFPGVLAAGLVVAPILATLVAATLMPVFTGALVLVAPGLALAAGASVLLLPDDAGLAWAAVAALAFACAVTIALRLAAEPAEDWRALAAAVERVRRDDETVVVVPEGARTAFAYYAPNVEVIRFARNDGAWVAVVAGTPAAAVEAARPAVNTPRYALLRQFRYGSELRLQHWIRP